MATPRTPSYCPICDSEHTTNACAPQQAQGGTVGTLPCACKVVDGAVFPPTYDQSACPTHGPNAPRYFVDHGTVHDRITGKHVEAEQVVALLNKLTAPVKFMATRGERVSVPTPKPTVRGDQDGA